jgi:hypothetical protein
MRAREGVCVSLAPAPAAVVDPTTRPDHGNPVVQALSILAAFVLVVVQVARLWDAAHDVVCPLRRTW